MSFPLSELDARARDIFRELVEAYLVNGEPVGSRTLSVKGNSGLSAASIRNVMQDLAEMGLLDSPHTSAGRMPTHLGLRLFVDGMLEIGDLAETERQEIEARMTSAGSSLSAALSEASSILSGFTKGAGLITTPKMDQVVRHVEFVFLGPGQALVVLVYEDGRVENRLMAMDAGLTPAHLAESSLFLNMRLKGKTLAEVAGLISVEVAGAEQALDAAAAKLIGDGLAQWTSQAAGDERKLIVRGRANLIDGQPSAEKLEQVRQLFDELEKKRALINVLDATRGAQSVKLFIGAENPMFALSGSALIVAPYGPDDRRVLGALGVIGPTRLNYARIIPMVDFTAKLLSRMIETGQLR